MSELLTHYWSEIVGRVGDPLSFQLVIQPAVAAVLGIRAGIRDARAHAPFYGWHVLTAPDRRGALARNAWKDIGKVFVTTVAIDLIYEAAVLQGLRLGPPMIVGLILVVPAYFLTRGPVNRLCRRRSLR